jgi:quinol monooxygenase YgiN
MIVPTRAEPGNLTYEACADQADPAAFALFEKYENADALTAHTETPHFAKYLRGEVLPNLSHRTRHDLAEVSAAPGCGSRIRTTAATSMRMIRPRRRAPGRVTSSGYPLNQLRLRWKPCSSSSASWRCCVSGTARSSSPIRLW